MNSIELRSKILEQLVKADDKLLKLVEAVLKKYGNSTDPFFELPPEAQLLIDKSLSEVKSKVRKHTDVLQEARAKYSNDQ